MRCRCGPRVIGWFLTPSAFNRGDNETDLCYIALLDWGLALAYSKQWRVLNYLAFGGTILMFGAWMDEWYGEEKLWTTIFFLTLFFVIFALLAVLYNVVNKRPTTWPDLALVLTNALLYFGTSYELLDDAHHSGLGVFAVLVSGFYLALGYVTNRRDREDALWFTLSSALRAVRGLACRSFDHTGNDSLASRAVLTLIGLKAETELRISGTLRFASLARTGEVDVPDFAYRQRRTRPLLNRRSFFRGGLWRRLRRQRSLSYTANG